MKQALILTAIIIATPFALALYGYIKSYLSDNPVDDSDVNWMKGEKTK